MTLSQPIEDVILSISRTKNETTIGGDVGMIVAVLSVNEISPGRIVPEMEPLFMM